MKDDLERAAFPKNVLKNKNREDDGRSRPWREAPTVPARKYGPPPPPPARPKPDQAACRRAQVAKEYAEGERTVAKQREHRLRTVPRPTWYGSAEAHSFADEALSSIGSWEDSIPSDHRHSEYAARPSVPKRKLHVQSNLEHTSSRNCGPRKSKSISSKSRPTLQTAIASPLHADLTAAHAHTSTIPSKSSGRPLAGSSTLRKAARGSGPFSQRKTKPSTANQPRSRPSKSRKLKGKLSSTGQHPFIPHSESHPVSASREAFPDGSIQHGPTSDMHSRHVAVQTERVRGLASRTGVSSLEDRAGPETMAVLRKAMERAQSRSQSSERQSLCNSLPPSDAVPSGHQVPCHSARHRQPAFDSHANPCQVRAVDSAHQVAEMNERASIRPAAESPFPCVCQDLGAQPRDQGRSVQQFQDHATSCKQLEQGRFEGAPSGRSSTFAATVHDRPAERYFGAPDEHASMQRKAQSHFNTTDDSAHLPAMQQAPGIHHAMDPAAPLNTAALRGRQDVQPDFHDVRAQNAPGSPASSLGHLGSHSTPSACSPSGLPVGSLVAPMAPDFVAPLDDATTVRMNLVHAAAQAVQPFGPPLSCAGSNDSISLRSRGPPSAMDVPPAERRAAQPDVFSTTGMYKTRLYVAPSQPQRPPLWAQSLFLSIEDAQRLAAVSPAPQKGQHDVAAIVAAQLPFAAVAERPVPASGSKSMQMNEVQSDPATKQESTEATQAAVEGSLTGLEEKLVTAGGTPLAGSTAPTHRTMECNEATSDDEQTMAAALHDANESAAVGPTQEMRRQHLQANELHESLLAAVQSSENLDEQIAALEYAHKLATLSPDVRVSTAVPVRLPSGAASPRMLHQRLKSIAQTVRCSLSSHPSTRTPSPANHSTDYSGTPGQAGASCLLHVGVQTASSLDKNATTSQIASEGDLATGRTGTQPSTESTSRSQASKEHNECATAPASDTDYSISERLSTARVASDVPSSIATASVASDGAGVQHGRSAGALSAEGDSSMLNAAGLAEPEADADALGVQLPDPGTDIFKWFLKEAEEQCIANERNVHESMAATSRATHIALAQLRGAQQRHSRDSKFSQQVESMVRVLEQQFQVARSNSEQQLLVFRQQLRQQEVFWSVLGKVGESHEHEPWQNGLVEGYKHALKSAGASETRLNSPEASIRSVPEASVRSVPSNDDSQPELGVAAADLESQRQKSAGAEPVARQMRETCKQIQPLQPSRATSVQSDEAESIRSVASSASADASPDVSPFVGMEPRDDAPPHSSKAALGGEQWTSGDSDHEELQRLVEEMEEVVAHKEERQKRKQRLATQLAALQERSTALDAQLSAPPVPDTQYLQDLMLRSEDARSVCGITPGKSTSEAIEESIPDASSLHEVSTSDHSQQESESSCPSEDASNNTAQAHLPHCDSQRSAQASESAVTLSTVATDEIACSSCNASYEKKPMLAQDGEVNATSDILEANSHNSIPPILGCTQPTEHAEVPTLSSHPEKSEAFTVSDLLSDRSSTWDSATSSLSHSADGAQPEQENHDGYNTSDRSSAARPNEDSESSHTVVAKPEQVNTCPDEASSGHVAPHEAPLPRSEECGKAPFDIVDCATSVMGMHEEAATAGLNFSSCPQQDRQLTERESITASSVPSSVTEALDATVPTTASTENSSAHTDVELRENDAFSMKHHSDSYHDEKTFTVLQGQSEPGLIQDAVNSKQAFEDGSHEDYSEESARSSNIASSTAATSEAPDAVSTVEILSEAPTAHDQWQSVAESETPDAKPDGHQEADAAEAVRQTSGLAAFGVGAPQSGDVSLPEGIIEQEQIQSIIKPDVPHSMSPGPEAVAELQETASERISVQGSGHADDKQESTLGSCHSSSGDVPAASEGPYDMQESPQLRPQFCPASPEVSRSHGGCSSNDAAVARTSMHSEVSSAFTVDSVNDEDIEIGFDSSDEDDSAARSSGWGAVEGSTNGEVGIPATLLSDAFTEGGAEQASEQISSGLSNVESDCVDTVAGERTGATELGSGGEDENEAMPAVDAEDIVVDMIGAYKVLPQPPLVEEAPTAEPVEDWDMDMSGDYVVPGSGLNEAQQRELEQIQLAQEYKDRVELILEHSSRFCNAALDLFFEQQPQKLSDGEAPLLQSAFEQLDARFPAPINSELFAQVNRRIHLVYSVCNRIVYPVALYQPLPAAKRLPDQATIRHTVIEQLAVLLMNPIPNMDEGDWDDEGLVQRLIGDALKVEDQDWLAEQRRRRKYEATLLLSRVEESLMDTLLDEVTRDVLELDEILPAVGEGRYVAPAPVQDSGRCTLASATTQQEVGVVGNAAELGNTVVSGDEEGDTCRRVRDSAPVQEAAANHTSSARVAGIGVAHASTNDALVRSEMDLPVESNLQSSAPCSSQQDRSTHAAPAAWQLCEGHSVVDQGAAGLQDGAELTHEHGLCTSGVATQSEWTVVPTNGDHSAAAVRDNGPHSAVASGGIDSDAAHGSMRNLAPGKDAVASDAAKDATADFHELAVHGQMGGPGAEVHSCLNTDDVAEVDDITLQWDDELFEERQDAKYNGPTPGRGLPAGEALHAEAAHTTDSGTRAEELECDGAEPARLTTTEPIVEREEARQELMRRQYEQREAFVRMALGRFLSNMPETLVDGEAALGQEVLHQIQDTLCGDSSEARAQIALMFDALLFMIKKQYARVHRLATPGQAQFQPVQRPKKLPSAMEMYESISREMMWWQKGPVLDLHERDVDLYCENEVFHIDRDIERYCEDRPRRSLLAKTRILKQVEEIMLDELIDEVVDMVIDVDKCMADRK